MRRDQARKQSPISTLTTNTSAMTMNNESDEEKNKIISTDCWHSSQWMKGWMDEKSDAKRKMIDETD